MFKKLTLAATAAVVTIGLATPAAAQSRINDRQDNQQQRIVQGKKSGALSIKETRRLVQQQRKIARYESRSRADGHGLSKRERLRLEAMQDRASKQIARNKNDRNRR